VSRFEGASGDGLRGRPWYVVLFLSVTWIVGVFGALQGAGDLAHLRGSSEVIQGLGQPDQSSNWDRPRIVRERARLAALGEHHRIGFPLAVAKLLVGGMLLVASSLALAGRRGARNMTLQAVAAAALLVAVEHWLTTPVRQAVAEAAAVDAVDNGQGLLPGLGRDESIAWQRTFQVGSAHAGVILIELGVFGGALLALTRRRAREFFAEAESRVPDESPTDPF
jgi:hypothetical protein